MTKTIFISSLISFLIYSCVSVGTVALSEDNLFQLEAETDEVLESIELEKYNKGVIADFNKGNINQWSGSSKIILTKKDGNLVVNAVGVGQEYDRFNYSFLPHVDFSKTNILKVRVKAKGDRIPTLRIDLKDARGYVTNSRDAKARLILCDEYVTYYFRYEGRFRQSWPVNTAVDKKNIAALELFINPGGSNFTGQLIIDEITPVSETKMWEEIASYSPPCNVSINTNFNDDAKFCWTNSNLYSISHEEQALKVTSRGAGSDYQSFGVGFSMSNLGERPIIQIRAKLKGESAAQLRVDMVDFSGNATNGDVKEVTIPNDNTYRIYYFDYQDKMFQGWPTTQRVDHKYISELMFFMNPGGPAMKGELFIDDIKLVTKTNMESWPKAAYYPLQIKETNTLFDAHSSNNTWWSATGKALFMDNKGLIIPNHITHTEFGTGTDVFSISKHKKIILTTGTTPSNLQIKIMDHRGETSSFITLKKKGNNLQADLTTLAGTNKKLNPHMITGLIFKSDEVLTENIIIHKVTVDTPK